MRAWILLSRPRRHVPLLSAISGAAIRWIDSSSVSHAAMAFELEPGQIVVWESTPPCVRMQPIDEWADGQTYWRAARLDLPNPWAALDWWQRHEGVEYGSISIIGRMLNRWPRQQYAAAGLLESVICSQGVACSIADGGDRRVAAGEERKVGPGDISRWAGLVWRDRELGE